jgi:hypothetical protein
VNKLLAERIDHERELRVAEKSAFDHERELRAIFDQHERELRLVNEAAVEKARMLQFEIYEQRLEGMNEFRAQLTAQAATFVDIGRFEREHKSLGDRLDVRIDSLSARMDQKIEDLGKRLAVESGVTIRQDTTQKLVAGAIGLVAGLFTAVVAIVAGVAK